jgi:hypothetical protein
MKAAIALVLFWWLVVGPHAHAGGARLTRPVWVIVLTITDRATGVPLRESELNSRFEFDDRARCESLVAKAAPAMPSSEDFIAVLRCREVTRI